MDCLGPALRFQVSGCLRQCCIRGPSRQFEEGLPVLVVPQTFQDSLVQGLLLALLLQQKAKPDALGVKSVVPGPVQ